MSVKEFNTLSSFIFSNYGIKLPLSKKTMLEGRLHKRLSILRMNSYKEYCNYVFSPEGQRAELMHMIDVVTTNKTDFFRENAHFDFLISDIISKNHLEFSAVKPYKVWSAGCSSGEEPYTLTMVLQEFKSRHAAFDYQIMGTDISSRALHDAAAAVYTEEKAAPIPILMKKKYLLKSRDPKNKTVRIVPDLRAKVSFERLNFIDGEIRGFQNFNAIFCRNVLIYFDRATQEKVLLKLCSKLEPGGYLFLGHSESIGSMKLPLLQVKPTTFKKL